jgi:hypothetical protein
MWHDLSWSSMHAGHGDRRSAPVHLVAMPNAEAEVRESWWDGSAA